MLLLFQCSWSTCNFANANKSDCTTEEFKKSSHSIQKIFEVALNGILHKLRHFSWHPSSFNSNKFVFNIGSSAFIAVSIKFEDFPVGPWPGNMRNPFPQIFRISYSDLQRIYALRIHVYRSCIDFNNMKTLLCLDEYFTS